MGQFSNAKKLLKDINAIQSPQDLLETFADMEQDMALYESGIQEVDVYKRQGSDRFIIPNSDENYNQIFM